MSSPPTPPPKRNMLMSYVNHVLGTPARISEGAARRHRGGTAEAEDGYINIAHLNHDINDIMLEPNETEYVDFNSDVTSPATPNSDFNSGDGRTRSSLYGTSLSNLNRPAADALFLQTEDLEDRLGSLPISNRSSSMSSGKTDLLSARSESSSVPSVSWGTDNLDAPASNKFVVVEIPSDIEEFNSICKRERGNGTTMCIKRGCTINHRGREVASARPGEIYVQKMTDVVFLEPSTHSSNISNEVLSKWIGSRKKISEWVVEFSVANSSNINEVLSTTDLLQSTTFIDHSRIHKSSGLLSVSGFDSASPFSSLISEEYLKAQEELIGDSARKRSLSDDELGAENVQTNRRKLSDELSQDNHETKLKGAIDHIFKLIDLMMDKLDKKDASNSEEIQVLFSNQELIHADMGTRSTSRTDRLEVPTVWGSIALLSGMIDQMKRDFEALPSSDEQKQTLRADFSRMEQEAMKTVNFLIIGIENQVKTNHKEVERNARASDSEIKRIEALIDKTQDENIDTLLLIAKGASVTKVELDKMKREFTSFVNKGQYASHSGKNQNCSNYVQIPDFIARMKKMDDDLDLIRIKISQIVSDFDSASLKSFGLGFRNRIECDSWADINLIDVPLGLVVDAHVVFEHLFTQISGTDQNSLKTWYNIRKLDLINMTQATCLQSFDTRVPKYLSKSSNLALPSTTRGVGVTHFDKILTYADWERPKSGFRDTIKVHLTSFQRSHQEEINHGTRPGTLGRDIATQCLQTSCTWINTFVSFIEDTYDSFIRQNSFTALRSWELTTQLGRRVLVDVAEPRNGVTSAINIMENAKTNKLVFWPMLQSHDVMKVYLDANFQDHPTISAEYVKFLVFNSGNDGKDDAASDLKSLREEIAKMQKNLTNALNTVDGQKTKISEFEKRLTTQEKKK